MTVTERLAETGKQACKAGRAMRSMMHTTYSDMQSKGKKSSDNK